MDLRRSHTREASAAKAGLSPTTGAQFDADPRLPSQVQLRAAAAARIRLPESGRTRSCRSCRPHRACGRSPSSRRSCGGTRNSVRDAADAGAAGPGLASGEWPGSGGDLPPGASAGPHGLVGLHRGRRSRRHHRRPVRSTAGSITSVCPSPASNTPMSCSAAKVLSRWRKGCRTPCGRWAAFPSNIAATASRQPSAISAPTPKRI